MKYMADYLSELMDEIIYDVSIKFVQRSAMNHNSKYVHGNIWINLEFYVSNPKDNFFYSKNSIGSIKLMEFTRDSNGVKVSAMCFQGKETTKLLSYMLGKIYYC